MKLQCSVTVINRLLPSLSIKSSTKYKNAVICISETPKGEIKLVLATKNNKGGYHYEVRGNIEKIFDQFIGQGKCTIRFKDPCHDLCITAQVMILKKFLSCIKQVSDDSKSPVPGICKKVCIASKTFNTNSEKLEIKRKKDYLTLKGFPSSLRTLIIHECSLTKFDSRILKLSNLTTLSITKNKLKELPVEFGNLQLKQLCLSYNKLGNEEWMFLSGRINNSLQYFDISGSEIRYNARAILNDKPEENTVKVKYNSLYIFELQIKYLSPSLSRFHSLRILKASNNFIQSIPPQICLLPKLQHLDISANEIRALPGTIRRKFLKKLDSLDISGNEGLTTIREIARYSHINSIHKENHDPLLSLMELSANCILNSKLGYNEEVLPVHLVKILDSAGQCSCGKMVIKNYGSIQHTIDPKTITNTFISSERQSIILLTFSSCSPKYTHNH